MVSRSSRCNRSQDVRICGSRFSAITRPVTVECYTPLDLDAEIVGGGAAVFKRLQQLWVRRDAGATPNQLNRRTLIDVGIPADLPQECGCEQARHRTTDDDGAALA